MRTMLDLFLKLNDNELGRFVLVGVKSKTQEHAIRDSLKDCTFSPQLNKAFNLKINTDNSLNKKNLL